MLAWFEIYVLQSQSRELSPEIMAGGHGLHK